MGDQARQFLQDGKKAKPKRDHSRRFFERDRRELIHGQPDEKGAIHKRFMQRFEQERAVQRKVEENPLLEIAQELAEEKKKQAAKALAEAARSRKVLVCGDARGDVEKLLSMADAQEKKVGSFDVVFCVGAFLPELGSDEENIGGYLRGEKQAARDCYFIDSNEILLQTAPRGITLGGNMHFLGAYGVRDICGLRVAFLSGRYDPAVYNLQDVDYIGKAFTIRAVNKLKDLVLKDSTRQGIDVLLTNGWPESIDRNIEDENQQPPVVPNVRHWQLVAAPPIAELCLAMEPRYHIFGSANIFYQRPPFQTPQRGHACRCIGLGHVGSPLSKQQRWLHALALSPMAHMKAEELAKEPPGTTPCPFSTAPAQGHSEPAAPIYKSICSAGETENSVLFEEAMSHLQGGRIHQYLKCAESLRDLPCVCGIATSSGTS